MIGVDFATPGLASGNRHDGFCGPAHHGPLPHRTLIGKDVATLPALPDRRVEVFLHGLNVLASDGVPARPMARTVG